MHLYQPQGGHQTVYTQETTGTNGGEATSTFNNPKQTQSAGSSAISLVHPLDQLSDEGDEDSEDEGTVPVNRAAGGVGGEVSPESASGGSKRKRTTRVEVNPEAVIQLDVFPLVALAERANLLVMQVGLRIQGSGLTHSGAGIVIECLKIKEGMFDALVAKHFLFARTQTSDSRCPAPCARG